ncbi:hypothetical protein BCR41DRAFT_345868 [Lobosporangium transversale]|uniref:Uncharacterized protein n=1 Tax=Lobosporangium transversale TaxID=64571 RepID=A0A1Y2H194_9FUNG|nr:hypothetical protein BCR41DRAFT_345868 [Lobosporangium transversale]ORZ27771.1 hypothetical protein BCR41DRAFT_345868 [Lobosporangium transversale]|eukprot:XP_021885474.1 hypothetical protein BCR41DRAFT_345868 [Lobosporangium transversale]
MTLIMWQHLFVVLPFSSSVTTDPILPYDVNSHQSLLMNSFPSQNNNIFQWSELSNAVNIIHLLEHVHLLRPPRSQSSSPTLVNQSLNCVEINRQEAKTSSFYKKEKKKLQCQ